MTIFNMVGDDTFILNDRPIHPEFADGDNITIEFPNEIMKMSTGKDSNTIYAKDAAGANVDCNFSVMRGGPVDKFLSGLLGSQNADFVSFPLMTGAFTKRLGNGLGQVTYDTYVLRGLAFGKNVGAKGNNNGDTEQGKVAYSLKGALAVRGLT